MYIHPFHPFGRGRTADIAPTPGREPLVGLWCWQSRRREDCGGGFARRLGVCQCHRARNERSEWSVAPEAVWKRWGRRALEQRKRPARRADRRPPGPGPERPTARSKEQRPRPKAWHCRSGAVFGSLGNGAVVDQTDNVCASSRNGCLLPARNTSGGILPGGGVEE